MIVALPMSDDLTDARREVVSGRLSAATAIERSIGAATSPVNARTFVATSFNAARAAARAALKLVATKVRALTGEVAAPIERSIAVAAESRPETTSRRASVRSSLIGNATIMCFASGGRTG